MTRESMNRFQIYKTRSENLNQNSHNIIYENSFQRERERES